MSESAAASWSRTKFVVGKGAFGTVSVGFNQSGGGRIFAVKSVEQSIGFRRQIESLENEIRILRSLDSPYVVGFLGDDVSHESPTASFRNLHMEFLPGGTVADFPAGAGDEKLLRARTWCVVTALNYVHSRGIVHCDVKGRNILVGRNPNFVKLADFGSAIEFSGDGDACRERVLPRGSPLWMAPEVVRGESQGPESDVWALGCTVIEMVTGRPAWDDCGAHTLTRIGYSDELPEFPTRLSETGRDFLRKCLRRNPSERWSCDRLLQHPFLASASPEIAVESSPRCVLDWVNADFDDDDEEEAISGETSGSDCRNSEISVRDRIGELSTSEWPNWASDGWSAVRGVESEAAAPARCDGEEGEGTDWEYVNLREREVETEGTSSEYWGIVKDNHGRLNAEYSNPGGMEFRERPRNNCQIMCGGGGGGSSGRLRAFEICIYSIELILCYYRKILMKQFVLFANYTLPFFFPSKNCPKIFSRERKSKISIL